MNANWTPFWAMLAAAVSVGGLYWWARSTAEKHTMPRNLDEFRKRRDEYNRAEQERRGSNGAA